MAALRWDEQEQAYTESETPMKYEPTAGAWTDTTGLAYNMDVEAWEEKWPSGIINPVMYNYGVWNSDVGKFIPYVAYGRSGLPIMSEYSNYFSISTKNTSNGMGVVASQMTVDITKYSKLSVYAYLSSTRAQDIDSVMVCIGSITNDDKYKADTYTISQGFGGSNNNVYETVSLDISSYTGSYNLAVMINDGNTAGNTRIHKIWLE